METIEYRTYDKSTWGAGPWQDEPDKIQYPDPVTGLPCLIVRNPMGALCGYVGVSEGHPHYKREGYDFDLGVHGGITFTDMCRPGEDEAHGVCHTPGPGEPDHVWWLGFDCAHHMDFVPKMALALKSLPGDHSWMEGDIYRDISYVKTQIASLAQQLKVLES
jgi:hypothetical protein